MNNIKKEDNQAIIDIGTNSIRLLIYRFDQGQLTRVYKTVRYTRMGQDVNQTGLLHPDAMDRSAEALEDYKKIMDTYHVSDPFIFGTSAMRDASNTEVFVQRIKEKLGFDIHVISGEREAQFGFLGVSQSFDEPVLIFDIGGGSTELILGSGDNIERMISLNMGCVRGTEKYLKTESPSSEELTCLALDFDLRLKHILPDFGSITGRKLIGIGGTATTVASMEQKMQTYDGDRINGTIVTKESLDQHIQCCRGLSLEERKAIIGLDEKRADVIIAGMVIMNRILSTLEVSSFTVCDYDNLEGAAFAIVKGL